MSIFGTQQMVSMDEMANSNQVLEAFFTDDLIRMNSDQIKEFCESEEAKILEEKAVLKKPTLMRLSKQDDLHRRTKLIAYQLAKADNYIAWKKLVKYTALRKESIADIMKKYGPRAEKIAKTAQKNYIQVASKTKATAQDRAAANAH
nr:MAG TPA: hypothetical protein [Herelleviridae sp.]